MKKRAILAGVVAVAIGGLAMMGMTSAAEIREAMDGSINTLTICNVNDSSECITIMDRNLGATTNDITSTGSYGYHYQWGNNHGFESCYESGCSTFPGGEETSSTQVDCSIYQPLVWANLDSYIVGHNDRCISPNINIWGGGNDSDGNNYGYPINNPKERQGPCPNGYHVPSIGEWSRLMDMRAGENTNGEIITYALNGITSISSKFQISEVLGDFKIPLVGVRGNDGKYVDYYTGVVVSQGGSLNFAGKYSLFESSTYGKSILVISGTGNMKVSIFTIQGPVGFIMQDTGLIANGKSLRCFRNTTLLPPKTMDIYVTVEGGNLTIGIGSGNGTLEKDLGSVTISNTDQERSGSFGSGYFRLEDMKGLESGCYTTLSVTDLVGLNNTGHIISGSNVSLKPTGLTVIGEDSASVSDSQVIIGSGNSRNDWRSPSESPITYINRQDTPMELAGRVGKRGDDLQVKVIIPANTLMDTYRGTITYTLFDCTEVDC